MPGGRTDMLTQERHDMAVKAFAQGASYEMAADCIGVCEGTIYKWKKRGEDEMLDNIESKYVEFVKSIKKARYAYEMSICKEIEKQGFSTWQAMAWLLERRNPKSFGRDAETLKRMQETKTEMLEIQEQFKKIKEL